MIIVFRLSFKTYLYSGSSYKPRSFKNNKGITAIINASLPSLKIGIKYKKDTIHVIAPNQFNDGISNITPINISPIEPVRF